MFLPVCFDTSAASSDNVYASSPASSYTFPSCTSPVSTAAAASAKSARAAEAILPSPAEPMKAPPQQHQLSNRIISVIPSVTQKCIGYPDAFKAFSVNKCSSPDLTRKYRHVTDWYIQSFHPHPWRIYHIGSCVDRWPISFPEIITDDLFLSTHQPDYQASCNQRHAPYLQISRLGRCTYKSNQTI